MTPASPATRLLRGYGPLLAFVLVFLLIALLVPTSDRPVVTRTVGGARDRRRSAPRTGRAPAPHRGRPAPLAGQPAPGAW